MKEIDGLFAKELEVYIHSNKVSLNQSRMLIGAEWIKGERVSQVVCPQGIQYSQGYNGPQ